MTLYNPTIKNPGTITILHPENLLDLVDYSKNWYIDVVVVGNVIMKHCFGSAFREIRENGRDESIIADIPDTAVYGIGYIEDYFSKRHNILSDFIGEFFHTLLCEFSRQNLHSMPDKNMQLLKFCHTGVYIYHE